MRRLPVAIILAAFAAAPAFAQDAEPTIEQAMAGIIHDALGPTAYGKPDYGWDAVSIRISSGMHWHLAPPDKAGAAETKRNGWIAADGTQVGVTAYGDADAVTSLSFDYKTGLGGDADDAPLLASLAAQGVMATEAGSRPNVFYPDAAASRIYTLTAPGRDTGQFTRSTFCTPPGSRAARRCWNSYELAFGG